MPGEEIRGKKAGAKKTFSVPGRTRDHQPFACPIQDTFKLVDDHHVVGLGDEPVEHIPDKTEKGMAGISPRQEFPGGNLGLILRAERSG